MDDLDKPANSNTSFKLLTTSPLRERVTGAVSMTVARLEHEGTPKDEIARVLNTAWQSIIVEFDLTDHAEKNISLSLMAEAKAFIDDRQDRISACFKKSDLD